MEIEAWVEKSWNQDAVLWNKSAKDWVEKWCADNVCLSIAQIPVTVKVEGKNNVVEAFEEILKRMDFVEYAFDSVFLNPKDSNSAVVFGVVRFQVGEVKGEILSVDRVRFNEQGKIQEIHTISDFGGMTTLLQENEEA